MQQAILLHALAVHLSAVGVPNPVPTAPPGLANDANIVLGWCKWGVLICGVAGLLVAGGKMAIGHFQSRSTMAADAATSIPWVIFGLSLVTASAGIVGVFL